MPSTSNVAATASGARNLLPICYRPVSGTLSFIYFNNVIIISGSLYSQFVSGGPKLPVSLSLVNMFDGNVTGSSKCDACILLLLSSPFPTLNTKDMWAIKEFLLSGESNASLMG